MKRILLFSLISFFLLPQIALAASPHFSVKEENFTIFFDETWRQSTVEDIENLPAVDKENLITSFFTVQKDVYLYIKKVDTTHPFFEIARTSDSYFKTTPEGLFKEERMYKPIETTIGKKIKNFTYDPENFLFFYETEKIKSSTTDFKLLSLWKVKENTLLEFQFIVYDDFKKNDESIRTIMQNIDFDFYSDTNTIAVEKSDRVLTKSEKETSKVENILDKFLTINTIYYLVGSLFIITLFVLIRKLLNRN